MCDRAEATALEGRINMAFTEDNEKPSALACWIQWLREKIELTG